MSNTNNYTHKYLNIHTIKHLALQVGIQADQILDIVSEIRKHYKMEEKKITKNGKVKTRQIYHPTSRLKKVIKAIDTKLLKKIALPAYMHGSVKNHTHITNAIPHCRQQYVCTIDIKDFFNNIKCHHVYNLFRRLNCSRDISRVLMELCTADGHVAQGYNTSSSIANLVIVPAVGRIEALCKKIGFKMTIYVDDITISGFKDPSPYINKIENILNECGFMVNHDKFECNSIHKQQKVTGIVVNNKPNLPNEEINDLRAKIHICREYSPNDLLLNHKLDNRNHESIDTVDKLQRHLNGKLNYLKQINPKKALALLTEFKAISW